MRKFESRAYQTTGTRDRPHCHRFPHSSGVEVAREHYNEMTARELEQLAKFVDGDTRQQAKEHNDQHSKRERALKANVTKGEDITFADAERAMVWVERVEVGVNNGSLSSKNARRLLNHVAKHTSNDGLSLMHWWYDTHDTRTTSDAFKGIAKDVYSQHVTPMELAYSAAIRHLNKDGTVSKTSGLARQKYIQYNEDGTVNRTCKAFKDGLVDEQGRPVDRHNTSIDAGKTHADVTVYSGHGRPRQTDYFPDGTLNRGQGQPATPTRATTTSTPTVYSGRGRPKATDYNPDGSVNYGDGAKEKTLPSQNAKAKAHAIVYSGRGRPKASDYNPDKSINYGSNSSGGGQGVTTGCTTSTTSGATTYSGRGRPRASDYTAGGKLRR